MIETRLLSPRPSRSPLGRPLDPSYVSNVVALVGAVVAGTVFLLLSGVFGITVAASPIGAAGAVFLAWAIAREIDPDSNGSAYLAMVIAFSASVFLAPSLLLAFGILVGTRLISATVGLPLKTTDLMALVAIGAVMGLGWTSLAGLFAVVAGTLVADGFSRRSWATGLLATIAALLTLGLRSTELVWESPGLGGLLLGAGLIAALGISLPASLPAATTDIGNRPIAARSIALARTTLLATIAVALGIAGKVGFEAGLAVAGSALFGTAVTAASRRLRSLGSREVENGGHRRGNRRADPDWFERVPARR